MITGKNIHLRTVIPADIPFILEVENAPGAHADDGNTAPYTIEMITDFVLNSHHDIFLEKQLRFIAELTGNSYQPVGLADLFEFDRPNGRVAAGIWISEPWRNKGYASEAVDLMTNWCFDVLDLNQVYCTVAADNEASIRLFSKLGFERTATRKNWIARGERWIDEFTMQKIRK